MIAKVKNSIKIQGRQAGRQADRQTDNKKKDTETKLS
jgi:hypothetical protein